MESKRSWPLPFTSALTKRETLLVLAYLPVHLVVLQLGFTALVERGALAQSAANFLYYLVGFLYMLTAAFGFLRRDFDPLAAHPLLCLREVLAGWCAMYCCNFLLAILLVKLLPGTENPNNAGVMAVVRQDAGMMKASLLYLTPPVEELLFRAGIFGVLRRRSRPAAYAVSALCFAVYHVAPYAMYVPAYWIFLLQYLPVSLLLARCYERTNSIWCSVFFHALINGVSLRVLSAL